METPKVTPAPSPAPPPSSTQKSKSIIDVIVNFFRPKKPQKPKK